MAEAGEDQRLRISLGETVGNEDDLALGRLDVPVAGSEGGAGGVGAGGKSDGFGKRNRAREKKNNNPKDE